MEFPNRIEHTVLGPNTTKTDVKELVNTADEYDMNVCVPPKYVTDAIEYRENGRTKVVTVIGFPHGTETTKTKVNEATNAEELGADELDMVASIGEILDGNTEFATSEIRSVVSSVSVPVKVIVESSTLTDDELRLACKAAKSAGADFVKTATGFNGEGAKIEDVSIMSEYLSVKASGGIGSYEKAVSMLEAGAERIGASSGDTIAKEWLENTQ